MTGLPRLPPNFEMDHDRLPCENDIGLSRLLPLYKFLRNECANAAHLTLLKGFSKAEQVQKCSQEDLTGVTFYKFLNDVHILGRKGYSKDENSKKKNKGATPSNNKKYNQIHNLVEHEDTLKRVTVQDLITHNVEKCQVLRDLDLSFVLNVVANEFIKYPLSESERNAVTQIKEIRNQLFHSKFNFTQEDFEKNFNELVKAAKKLYEYAGVPKDFENIKRMYQDQVEKEDSPSKIFEQLQMEIHRKYTEIPTYVHPVIVDVSAEHEHIVEDLPKYILEHSKLDSSRIHPVVLCGPAGSGKSTVLRSLASSSCDRYSLVLYLDDWGRKSTQQRVTADIGSSSDFWQQLRNCVRHQAPNTVRLHDLPSVIAVMRMYMKDILFLVDWNMKSLGSIFKDMTLGTWVVAHRYLEGQNNDWQILNIKPLTEGLVVQLLYKCGLEYQNDDILNCEYKEMLTSPDIVKVFHELKSNVTFNTDFELIEAFVDKKLKSMLGNRDVTNDVLKLGEVAFNALKNGSKHIFKDKDLGHIDGELRDLFLVYYEGKGLQFAHSSVQEYLAACYVVERPKKACREWLLNVPQFMNVFKFACGMWCCKYSKHLEEMVCYIEEYLVELFDIRSLKKRKGEPEVEPMEVDGKEKKKTRPKKEKKPAKADDPFRHPFTHWCYMTALDDVCRLPRILVVFAKLLSHSKYWIIKANEMDSRKWKRIEKVIKKVKFTKESPVTIKLDSGVDVTALVDIWTKLKNIERLHDCAFIKISVNCGKGFPFIEKAHLTNLCNTLVRAHCPVYVMSYKGPLFCSTIPEFLKCSVLRKLVSIDVTVFDIASLCEILNCDDLSYLEDITVRVELSLDEQYLTEEKYFRIPKHPSLRLMVKYFSNIQTFLNRAKSTSNLKSLCIYDVYVSEKFNLDLSSFRCLEKLGLLCEPFKDQSPRPSEKSLFNRAENICPGVRQEAMDVDEVSTFPLQEKRIPRQSWLMPITGNLKLPQKLERLLLRNMDFFNNSNYFVLNILEKHNIQKLVILDCQLSLKGVRRILSSHTNDGGADDIDTVTKKLKHNKLETTDMHKLVSKRPRLSLEEREQKRSEKPKGKEVVITSDIEICRQCCRFPCLCPDCDDGLEAKDGLDDVVYLIEDVYEYDIISFNYSSKVVTVRKDVCGDLRVHCAFPGLNDEAISNHLTTSVNSLSNLFKMLTLAQCICLENTDLTFKGVKLIIDYLKYVKVEYSVSKVLEPFSLTFRSSYHPSNNQVIEDFIATIQREKATFTSFNFWCSCENKCFKIKRTHAGKIVFNDRILPD